MTRAILTILGAIFSFSLMGVAVRFLTADYSVFQISFTRNLFGFLPILLMLAYSRQIKALKTPFVPREWLICVTRGGSVAIAQICLFTAYISSNLLQLGRWFLLVLSL